MIDVFTWWLLAEILGLAALPLAFRIFRWLPDRGYTFAKTAGLLLASYLLWVGASMRFLRNDDGGILFGLGLAALISFAAYRRGGGQDRQSLRSFLGEHKPLIACVEILFTLAFLAWVALRAYAPDKIMSAGGEKFMEIAFLNGVLNSAYFPPLDPWLSGFSISYYYFGYVMMGLLTQLSGVLPGVGFDLYDALLFALTVQGAFGVVYNLVAGSRGAAPKLMQARALAFGLLGGVFVAILGNLEGLLEAVYSRGILPAGFWRWLDIPDLAGATVSGSWNPGSSGGWWWWRASRVIQDRDLLYRAIDVSPITEFPFFSFLLGDNHPHVLALPFVLLAIAVALNLLRRQAGVVPAPHSRSSAWNPIALTLDGDWLLFLFSALFLGSLGFLNTWDLPIYLALAAAAYAAGLYVQRKRIDAAWFVRVAALGLGLGLAAVLLYIFFYTSFSSQASGLLPYIFPPTRLPQYLTMFGTFVFILAGFLAFDAAVRARETGGRNVLLSTLRWWAGILLVPAATFLLLLGAVSLSGTARSFLEGLAGDPASPLGGLDMGGLLRAVLLSRLRDPWLSLFLSAFLALGVTALLGRLRSAQAASPGHLFALLLLLAGLLLSFSVEFFYLRDNFGVRMNTVFKFYYQAWVMLGCASAYGLWWAWEGAAATIRRVWRAIFLAGSALLILAGMAYPLLAYRSRVQDFRPEPDLNGAANIAQGNPDDWAAIEWLRVNVVTNSTSRNATGDIPVLLEAPGHSYNYEGRISAFTGLPAVLGWALHEAQWRGSYDEQARREPDIATIYSSSDARQALELLEKWGVSYVIVGNTERQYVAELCREPNRSCSPARALAKFDALLEPVFGQGGTMVYRVPGISD